MNFPLSWRALSLLSCALGLVGPIVAQSPFHFEGAANSYLPHQGPGAARVMTLFDRDGDGDRDLARLHDGPLLQLAENVDGALANLQTISLSGWTWSDGGLADGDFNLDGFPDLAVAGKRINGSTPLPTLRLFLGSASGTMTPQPDSILAVSPLRIRAGDLDGNGSDEILVLGRQNTRFEIFRPGGSANAVDVGEPIVDLLLEDFDGDGVLDLVLLTSNTGSGAQLRVWTGNGASAFVPARTFPAQSNPRRIFAVDVDDDGDLDVLTDDDLVGQVDLLVHRNDGSAVFSAPVRTTLIQQYWEVFDVVTETFAGDGHPDLLIGAGQSGNTGALFSALGDGAGGFSLHDALPLRAEDFELVDFDGDGSRDLVTVDGQVLTPARDGGLGGFRPAFSLDTLGAPATVAVDFDRDGIEDLALSDRDDPLVHLLRADGEGNLTLVATATLSAPTHSLVAGDVDGDGDDDLVGLTPGQVSTMPNNGSGQFAAPVTSPITGFVGYKVASGDLDGDGRLDLVLTDKRSSAASILLGRSDGGFDETTWDMGDIGGDIRLRDVTGDGQLDLVHVSAIDQKLVVRPGQGDGSFGASSRFSFPASSRYIAVGDVDGDQDDDVLVARNQGAVLLLNDGAGRFARSQVISGLPVSAEALALLDLDGDGDRDAVLLGAEVRSSMVLLENVGGTFVTSSPPIAVAAIDGCIPGAIGHGDFDADGRVDLVLSVHSTITGFSSVYVRWNRSNLHAHGVPTPGGNVQLELAASSRAGQMYVVLPSLRGTYPGLPLLGNEILPLNPDIALWGALGNTAFFRGFGGFLDSKGTAQAFLDLPPIGELEGLRADFAFITLDGFFLRPASNSARVTIL